jgi:AraC-like DNA-binding protein
MDALSEALNAVRMTGAIFFHAECAAPWGFAVPSVSEVQHVLSPGTERLVNYNLMTEGTAVARFGDGEEVTLRPGDLTILPHGDAHTVSNGSPRAFIDDTAGVADILRGNVRMLRFGEDGEITRFICGFFGCERSADRLFLAGLPRLIRINIRENPASAWLETAIRHLVSEAESERPGRSILLSRMAESLFIEALRCYMEQLPSDQTGWLAGARDPIVGGILALLHRDPSHDWTLDMLASAVGASRSVIAKRFDRFIGDSPHGLSGALAPGAGGKTAARLGETGHPDRRGGRLRIRSGLQPRLQAIVRAAAGAIPATAGQRNASGGRRGARQVIKCGPVARFPT